MRTRTRFILIWLPVTLVLCLLVLLAPTPAAAQTVCTGTAPTVVCTGIPTPGQWLEWDASDNIPTAAAAQAMEPRIRVDGALVAITTETCAAPNPPQVTVIRCRVQLATTPQLTALLTIAGQHAVVMRIFDPATSLEGTDSIPFVLRSPPAAPTGLRITPQAAASASDPCFGRVLNTRNVWQPCAVRALSPNGAESSGLRRAQRRLSITAIG